MGAWRNAYLYGAQELREGVRQLPPRPMLSPDVLAAVTAETLFDFIAVRLDPKRVAGRSFVIGWLLADSGERLVQTLRHSTLTQVMHKVTPDVTAQVSTTRETLVALIVRRTTVAQALAAGTLSVKGDETCVAALFDMLDDFALQFDVVTPGPERR